MYGLFIRFFDRATSEEVAVLTLLSSEYGSKAQQENNIRSHYTKNISFMKTSTSIHSYKLDVLTSPDIM